MKHNEHHTTNIKDMILGKINSKEITMHSKQYFYLRVGALVFASVLMFLISIFIINFILFSIRINSEDAFLFLGPRGWGAFLYFFPWQFLALDVVLVGGVLWLLRQFKFGYQSPIIYLLALIFVFAMTAGFIIDRTTGINERFLHAAEGRRLPAPIGEFYRGVRHPHPGFEEITPPFR